MEQPGPSGGSQEVSRNVNPCTHMETPHELCQKNHTGYRTRRECGPIFCGNGTRGSASRLEFRWEKQSFYLSI
jgi:hypothetical protein